MAESLTNQRRHAGDLPIRDKDLITGRDARRIVREQFDSEWRHVVAAIDGAISRERQRLEDEAAKARAAVWYRRLWRKVRP